MAGRGDGGGRSHWPAWLAAGLIVLPAASLAPHAGGATELVRLRNTLIFDAQPESAFAWTPETAPADFQRETAPPDPRFVAIAQRLGLAALPDDWQRALAIARHLLGSAPKLVGEPVQQDLFGTYVQITQQGRGYCADFVRVFQAIAGAAGMPMRAWAFSFDGFGGHGHVLPEIWDRSRGAWRALDLFDNVYFTDERGEPVSALALRRAIRTGTVVLPRVLLQPGAAAGYEHEDKLWAYYRRGAAEWYLWSGNNPFGYERAAAVRLLAPLSRPLSQLAAIAAGVHPRVTAVASEDNAAQRAWMARTALHLKAAAAAMAAGVLGLAGLLFVRRRAVTGAAR